MKKKPIRKAKLGANGELLPITSVGVLHPGPNHVKKPPAPFTY